MPPSRKGLLGRMASLGRMSSGKMSSDVAPDEVAVVVTERAAPPVGQIFQAELGPALNDTQKVILLEKENAQLRADLADAHRQLAAFVTTPALPRPSVPSALRAAPTGFGWAKVSRLETATWTSLSCLFNWQHLPRRPVPRPRFCHRWLLFRQCR